jgi:hypothetical protein
MRSKKLGLGIAILAVITLLIGGIMVFGANFGDVAIYFPLNPGSTWTYKVSTVGGTDSALHKIKATESENNPQLIVYDSKNNPQVFIYYTENEQGLFKTKMMGPSGIIEYKPAWLVLSSKMNVGATWSWESSDHKMKETSKVLAGEKVTVAAGTFETILIVCDGVDEQGNAYTEKTWYAKGVGYVKDENTFAGKTNITELTEYNIVK